MDQSLERLDADYQSCNGQVEAMWLHFSDPSPEASALNLSQETRRLIANVLLSRVPGLFRQTYEAHAMYLLGFQIRRQDRANMILPELKRILQQTEFLLFEKCRSTCLKYGGLVSPKGHPDPDDGEPIEEQWKWAA